ncbi:hypothetical protein O6P43_007040 [Quillaja saponaria]|uniref:Uncharacterized protein n=1 Tax=Quillaja saponaria TaxID=32244 RepID=A0AAD7VJ32_QUISA|nr:hypothetical protein O6P43_007040 [Quillaja saponaria]
MGLHEFSESLPLLSDRPEADIVAHKRISLYSPSILGIFAYPPPSLFSLPYPMPLRRSHSPINFTSNNPNSFGQCSIVQVSSDCPEHIFPRWVQEAGDQRPWSSILMWDAAEEVLSWVISFGLIDEAVFKWVGIVVLKCKVAGGFTRLLVC